MDSTQALKAAGDLRALLQDTTARLAGEVVAPSDRAPAWDEFGWRMAMAVSVMHGISGLLAQGLRWRGPPLWQAFLAEQLEQGRRREARARRLLATLDAAAQAAGVPLLAMKGSALLAEQVYAAGVRPMSDVDLLARPADVAAADGLIRATGYVAGACGARHRAYEPPGLGPARAFGEHEANPTKIELHGAVREPLPLRQVDITAGLLSPDAAPGIQPYASRGALMRHLLLHTAGNLCHRSVRLVQLHDIARLGRRLNAADWQTALAPGPDGRPAWWAAPPLVLAQRFVPGMLPDTGLDAPLQTLLAACPAGLRRHLAARSLAAWSLSHPSTPMLPGIDWAQGAGEALAFAWRRLHPTRAQHQAQQQSLQREAWLAGSAWMRQPRWRKALSFLHGAPPRVQTMDNLHRALAYRPASSA